MPSRLAVPARVPPSAVVGPPQGGCHEISCTDGLPSVRFCGVRLICGCARGLYRWQKSMSGAWPNVPRREERSGSAMGLVPPCIAAEGRKSAGSRIAGAKLRVRWRVVAARQKRTRQHSSMKDASGRSHPALMTRVRECAALAPNSGDSSPWFGSDMERQRFVLRALRAADNAAAARHRHGGARRLDLRGRAPSARQPKLEGRRQTPRQSGRVAEKRPGAGGGKVGLPASLVVGCMGASPWPWASIGLSGARAQRRLQRSVRSILSQRVVAARRPGVRTSAAWRRRSLARPSRTRRAKRVRRARTNRSRNVLALPSAVMPWSKATEDSLNRPP